MSNGMSEKTGDLSSKPGDDLNRRWAVRLSRWICGREEWHAHVLPAPSEGESWDEWVLRAPGGLRDLARALREEAGQRSLKKSWNQVIKAMKVSVASYPMIWGLLAVVIKPRNPKVLNLIEEVFVQNKLQLTRNAEDDREGRLTLDHQTRLAWADQWAQLPFKLNDHLKASSALHSWKRALLGLGIVIKIGVLAPITWPIFVLSERRIWRHHLKSTAAALDQSALDIETLGRPIQGSSTPGAEPAYQKKKAKQIGQVMACWLMASRHFEAIGGEILTPVLAVLACRSQSEPHCPPKLIADRFAGWAKSPAHWDENRASLEKRIKELGAERLVVEHLVSERLTMKHRIKNTNLWDETASEHHRQMQEQSTKAWLYLSRWGAGSTARGLTLWESLELSQEHHQKAVSLIEALIFDREDCIHLSNTELTWDANCFEGFKDRDPLALFEKWTERVNAMAHGQAWPTVMKKDALEQLYMTTLKIELIRQKTNKTGLYTDKSDLADPRLDHAYDLIGRRWHTLSSQRVTPTGITLQQQRWALEPLNPMFQFALSAASAAGISLDRAGLLSLRVFKESLDGLRTIPMVMEFDEIHHSEWGHVWMEYATLQEAKQLEQSISSPRQKKADVSTLEISSAISAVKGVAESVSVDCQADVEVEGETRLVARPKRRL